MAVRAGVYTRISDDPEDLQEGVTRQREDCEDVAAERGWEIAAFYTDNDKSAYNPKKPRPEYRRMIDDSSPGPSTPSSCGTSTDSPVRTLS
jgi:site-specific DNA recombinase